MNRANKNTAIRTVIFTLALSFTTNVVLAAAAQQAAPPTNITHVDIRDVARFRSKEVPQIVSIMIDFRLHPERYFPNDVKFSDRGATYPWKTQTGLVYGAELTQMPVARENGRREFQMQAFFRSESKGYLFRRFTVLMYGPIVEEVHITEDIPLNQANFTVRVSLVDRRVILEDAKLGIQKIFPLDVGGFDEGIKPGSLGKTRLLTPIYERGYLAKDMLMMARAFPDYFKKRPFVRVSNSKGLPSAIGFHIEQGDGLVRGFESHGCMRLREKDLYEMATILFHGPVDQLNLNLALATQEAEDHPFPRSNNSYNTVKNFGTVAHPFPGKDKDGLTQLIRRKATPPVEKLLGI